MMREMVQVIQEGDEAGNGMMFRLKLSSGLEILGLPTENAYGGGWDLGPTWNYVVLGDKPFLIDAGRFGMGRKLLDMMEAGGMKGEDLDFVMVSHGHEDHDGGVYEIARTTGAKVRAHVIYDRLSRLYPDQAPPFVRKDFPASCWRCFMPESFTTKNCREYHQARTRLKIEAISDGYMKLDRTSQVYHVPGHSPDSLAVLVGGEAIIVGDTVLPDITPWPSQEDFFVRVGDILKPEYTSAQAIYGLRAYIRSLKKLREMGKEFSELIVLPAHRLFYNNQWNEMALEARTEELIAHHIERCGAIMKILEQGPKTAREIAVAHFEESLLK
ncbi:MAG: MBL fold metallo-hydrolase, partial [Deltaproteobacteria bacterium]|nr:MBL fold metallo-hydrolase [Deltaproteobacteria bacterium]